MTLPVAFVVSYVAAGLAEELAKYFSLARYYPDTKDGDGQEKDDDRGCDSPAAGWYAPLANPRVAVYLAFVVGLGFSWTENIQYGAQVYQVASLWKGENVTYETNITVTPKWNWSYSVSSSPSAFGDGGGTMDDDGRVFYDDDGEAQRSGEIDMGTVDTDQVNDQVWRVMRASDGPNWEAVEEGKSVREVLVSHFSLVPPLGSAPGAAVQTGWGTRGLQLGLGMCKLSSHVRAGVDLDRVPCAMPSAWGDANQHPRLYHPLRMGDAFGDDEGEKGKDGKKTIKNRSFNMTVNVTVLRQSISEETKRAAAISVILMRGVMPLHAVWAGLTATRYVRQVWLDTSVSRRRGSGVDVFGCISWSWLYHGTFDFAIMSIPALVAMNGSVENTVLTMSTIAFTMMLLSWVHLARATFWVERELMAAGIDAPGDGAGVPRLGTCTGRDRRRCCCCCLPFVACFCGGMADWEEGSESVSYGSIPK